MIRSNADRPHFGAKPLTSKQRRDVMTVALEAVVDAVMATDADAAIVYFNPAAETITGWRAHEALGKPLNQVFFLVDPATDKLLDSPFEPAAGPHGLRHAALVNRRGLQVEIEYRVVPLPDEAASGSAAVVVCRPRRHAAEVALQTSNESLLANADELFEARERAQVTLNSIGDAVISTNFSGRVTYFNGVAETMIGLAPEVAVGREVDEIFRLVDSATRARIPCPTAEAIIQNRRVSLQAACSLLRSDAQEIAVEVSAAPIHDRNGGVIGAVMVAHDVTASRELSLKLTRLALHDSLTDLPNRALFTERLGVALSNARAQGRHAALLYVDLDRFKEINDSLGHAIGDKLLQTVARRLLGCVRSSDTVSRHGGDEFVVLLPEIPRGADAAACADKILGSLDAPYRFGEHELRLTASIGIAVFPDDGADAEALLRGADAAMYRAKTAGRNKYAFA